MRGDDRTHELNQYFAISAIFSLIIHSFTLHRNLCRLIKYCYRTKFNYSDYLLQTFLKLTRNFIEHWHLLQEVQGKFFNSDFFFRVPSSFNDFNNSYGYPNYSFWWHVTVYVEGPIFKISRKQSRISKIEIYGWKLPELEILVVPVLALYVYYHIFFHVWIEYRVIMITTKMAINYIFFIVSCSKMHLSLWPICYRSMLSLHDKMQGAICDLQWLTGYLGLALIFIWESAQRREFSFCFSRVFCWY